MANPGIWAGLDDPVVHFESDSPAPVFSEMEPSPDGETQPDYGQDDGEAENEKVERPKVETDSGQRHVPIDHQNDSDQERDPVRGTCQQRFRPAVGRCLTSRRDPICYPCQPKNSYEGSFETDEKTHTHYLSGISCSSMQGGFFLEADVLQLCR
jgi:hypothetical protein